MKIVISTTAARVFRITFIRGGQQGPPGPTGPQGPQGPTGPPGPAGASTWDDIADKPTAFPSTIALVSGLQAALDDKVNNSMLAIPAGRVVYGTGAGIDSDSFFVYSAANKRLSFGATAGATAGTNIFIKAGASGYPIEINRAADNVKVFYVDYYGNVKFGGGGNKNSILGAETLSFGSGSVQIFSALAGTAGGRGLNFMTQNSLQATTQYASVASFSANIIPTSGNAIFGMIDIVPTINQTGTSSGAVNAIYYAPTVTNVRGPHYFINALAGRVKMLGLTGLNYANDSAAAAAGLDIGELYHNAGAMRIRLT